MKKTIFSMMFLLAGTAQAQVIEFMTTNAGADAGWITLLQNEGYTVNAVDFKYDDLSASDIADLNAADLAIISRQTSSGLFNDDAANWNTITTPILSCSAFQLRVDRAAWIDSGALVQGVTGNLVALEPADSLFNGIGLDGNGQLQLLADPQNFDSDITGTNVGNAEVLATDTSGNVWLCFWEADVPFYDGGATPAGARAFFGVGTDGGNNMTLNAAGEQLFLNVLNRLLFPIPRAEFPDPANGNTTVSAPAYAGGVSWQAPSDPNIASVDQYDVYWSVGDPNLLDVVPVNNGTSTTFVPTPAIDVETTYYWRVDTHVTWDANQFDAQFGTILVGDPWTFTTLPANEPPAVDTGPDLVTTLGFLPVNIAGTVTDLDTDTVTWSIIAGPGFPVPAVAQMQDRGGNDGTSDPNLLRDWIGSDTRSVGDPLVLTISDLPAGSYNWLSYHHDPEDQTGLFDVTVNDANGSATTTDLDISDTTNGGIADLANVTTFSTTLVSDGSDISLLFFQQTNDPVQSAFFVMNGFVLDDGGSNSLNIDFSRTGGSLQPGMQGYFADHEVLATFSPQSYNAFSSTVTVDVEWGLIAAGIVNASVTDTTNDASSASQTAGFTTNTAGTYTIELAASDTAAQNGSDTMQIVVGADPCEAAQVDSSWPGFNVNDADGDCDVDLFDFSDFVLNGWQDDRSLTGQVTN